MVWLILASKQPPLTQFLLTFPLLMFVLTPGLVGRASSEEDPAEDTE